MSKLLIEAAVEFAKERGAQVVSAFPIPDQERQHFPAGEAEFGGRFSSFLKLGFTPVERLSKFYYRMELSVRSSLPQVTDNPSE